jgi:hypothetical protein
MKPSLRNLAAEEDRVAQLIAESPADLEERDRVLARRGVYRYYEAIFNAYRAIVEESSGEGEDLAAAEALRRIVFLAWYSCLAPPQLSGMGELSDQTLEDVFSMAEHALDDHELAWMLPRYFHEAPIVFTRLPGLDRLCAVLTERSADAWRDAGVTLGQLVGRGAMSRYWLGVLARAS